MTFLEVLLVEQYDVEPVAVWESAHGSWDVGSDRSDRLGQVMVICTCYELDSRTP